MWEYKLFDDEELHGPFTSEQMLKMQQEHKFDSGGVARKVGSKVFYNVERLDFEIYTDDLDDL